MLIRYTYIRLYLNALKRIKPYMFAGIGYSLDYHIDIRTTVDTQSLQKFARYRYGTENHSNSFSSGLTFNILYDTRTNLLNPLPGWYWNAVYRINPRFLGSDDFWQSIYLDARKYIPFSREKQNMLALWSYFWTSLGNKTPYLDLPAIGQDPYQKSGRGIYPSHYMGQTLFYLEAEYRRDITRDGLLGFVVFSNVNAVTEPSTDRFSYLHPAVGTGLRVKFNKHSGTNITLDIATSKGRTAFYMGLGEVF
jgi:outer membrane protein assembly factor BamA